MGVEFGCVGWMENRRYCSSAWMAAVLLFIGIVLQEAAAW